MDFSLHSAYGLKHAVSALKRIKKSEAISLPQTLEAAKRIPFIFKNKEVQRFDDEFGNQYWAMNLQLQKPSFFAAKEYLAGQSAKTDVILGACSKGYSKTEGAFCPLRVRSRKQNGACVHDPNIFPEVKDKANRLPCLENPCIVGHLHQTINLDGQDNRGRNRFYTIAKAVDPLEEIPGFFKMNTDKGEDRLIICGLCHFSIGFIVLMAKLFPNIRGILVSYDRTSSCRTFTDVRSLENKGKGRLSRFFGSEGEDKIEHNPISRLVDSVI